MDEERLTLHLNRDEALVLSDLLFRWIDQSRGQEIGDHIKDDAEIWVLNALNCSLETLMTEALDPEYDAALQAARERVRERNGGCWPWRGDAPENG